jgi:acyl-CoA thioesterase
MSAFDDDTALAPAGEGRWRGAVPPTWSIGFGTNGGFMAALGARAAELATGAPPRSLTLHYLAPPAEAPIEAVTEVVRQGRSTSFVRITLTQEGTPVVTAQAVCGAWYEDAPSWSDATPPVLPPLEDCLYVDPTRTGVPPLMSRYDMRVAQTDPGERPLQVAGYLRTADAHVADHAVLAAMTDAFMPPAIFRTPEAVRVPTLELTIHFRGQPPQDPHPWIHCTFVSRLAAGGVVEEDGELWSADGRLLAQSRQLALMRSMK